MNPLNTVAINHLADAYAWGVINEEMQHLSVEKALIHLLFTDLMLFGGVHEAKGFGLHTSMRCYNVNNMTYDPDPKRYTCLTLTIKRDDGEEILTIIYGSLIAGIHEWWYGVERPDDQHVKMDAHWHKFFYDVVHWYEAAKKINLLTGRW